MSPINLSLIVAMTPERIIGNEGKLPWGRLPSDMIHFKKVTIEAGIVIMGRKTWESIPEKFRPLHFRRNIILTRGPIPSTVIDSVHFVGSVEEAYSTAAMYGKHACVTGGEEIYRLFLEVPDLVKAYITTVNTADLIGDAHFPRLESGPNHEWKCTEKTRMCKVDPRDAHETSLSVWERFGIV